MASKKVKTLELSCELATTSLMYGLIGETIEEYKGKNHKDIKIRYDVLRAPDKFSLSYKILISSKTVNEKTLCQVSCELRDKICQLEEFKDLLVITRDDANKLMCETLYPQIFDIETRLRAITNRIFMQYQGKNWNQELKHKTKQANDKRNSGFDLNQLTLGTLVNLLFIININENNSVPNNLEKLSSKELIDIINNIRYKTLWQQSFSNIDLKIQYMNDLLRIRNDVMHFKLISFKDFIQNLDNCEKINSCLNQAENQIAGEKFELSQEVKDSLKILAEGLEKLFNLVKENAQVFNEAFKAFSNIKMANQNNKLEK